ncbi:MAG: S8 family serine peptidase [Pirellulales bacterium]|nr:S8 family serine peptidase [Pirellulales bacterium]
MTPTAAEEAGGVAGVSAAIGSLGFSYEVQAGLGLPGMVRLATLGASPQATLAELVAHPAIALASPNLPVNGSATNPDDPFYAQGLQFGLRLSQSSGVGNLAVRDSDISAPEAWDLTQGSSDVVVAVLDSGIDYNHVDLNPNIWTDFDGRHGYDFYDDDDDPFDLHGHGTHVAGIIGAAGNNATGVTGVNWEVSLMGIRVLGPQNTGTIDDVIAGVNYVTMLASRSTNPVNVRVINASFAIAGQFVNQGAKSMLRSAIESAATREILVVVAAGNGDVFGQGIDLNTSQYYPATIERDQAVNLENLIVVAASDPYDRLASFSNYGSTAVDLAAPGDDIISTLPGDQYGYRDGTSMATPHVSGVAALVLARSPDLSASEVREAILNTVDPLATPEDRAKVATGGRLNAHGAVAYDAFAPRATIVSAPDVITAGSAVRHVTIRYSARTPIDQTTIGIDDIIVRRGAEDAPVTVQSVTSASVPGNPNALDATYALIGPGEGIWNALDNGLYTVEVIAGAVADTAGSNRPAQKNEYRRFADEFAVNVTAGALYVNRADDSLDGSGGLTLRAAVQQANASPGSVIFLAPNNYVLSLAGAGEDSGLTGDLDVTGTFTIAVQGSGSVTIDGGLLDRVFDVHPEAHLTLEGIAVTRGALTGGDGAGIRNRGTLTLIRSVVADNHSMGNGGGIGNFGELTVTDSTVTGNFAALNGGGVYNSSTGVASFASSTIDTNVAAGQGSVGYNLVGTPIRANSPAAGYQRQPRVSINEAGQLAIAWIDYVSDFDQRVDVRRFLFDGTAVDSVNINVTGQTPGGLSTVRRFADVAIAPDGSFLVAGPATINSNWDVQYRVYPAEGTPTSLANANALTTGNQFETRVAVAPDGTYSVVFWTNSESGGNGDGALLRRFDAAGANLGVESSIPQIVGGHQNYPAIAHFDNGEAIAVFSDTGLDGVGNGVGVYARFVNASGVPYGNQFQVNSTLPGNQTYADVAAGPEGFVVAWLDEGRGVVAQRFNRAGQKLASNGVNEIEIASIAGVTYPSVAMLPGGGFVVAWGESRANPALYDIFVQAYDGAGEAIGAKTRVSAAAVTGYAEDRPSVASNSAGQVVVAWGGFDAGSDGRDIFVQRLQFTGTTVGGQGGGVYNAGSLSAVNATISANVAKTRGGGLSNADDADSTLVNVTVADNSISGPAIGTTLIRSGAEALVNDVTSGVQDRVRVATATSGAGVILWTDAGTSLRAQRFNSSGGLVGSDFQPNDVAADAGDVAVGANGDAAFVYRVNSGGSAGWDVRAKLYNAQGVVIRSEFVVNSGGAGAEPGDQLNPRIKALPGGGYLVAWYDLQSGSAVLHGRFLDAAGNVQGAEFSISTTAPGYAFDALTEVDFHPLADGTAWAVYRASSPLGDNIVGQRLSAAGAKLGGEVPISGNLTGADRKPVILGDDDGFVVLWRNAASGILMRRFDPTGAPLGDPIPVAASVHDTSNVGVTQLPNGALLAVWDDYSSGGATGGPAQGRLIGRDGAFLSDAFALSTTSGWQTNPGIARLAGRQLLLAWAGPTAGDAAGVVAQIFVLPEFPGSGVANAAAGSVTLQNTIVAANNSADGRIDVSGDLFAIGGNVVGRIGVATGAIGGVNSNRVGDASYPLDPLLGPLALNNGTTRSHALLPGSPALDAGLLAGAPANDQRGVERKDSLGVALVDGDGDGMPAVDAGAVESFYASISGVMYHDRNGNGVRDPANNETPLADWIVYLDLDEDGRLDDNEPRTIAGADGSYHFVGLNPGKYVVAAVNKAGWQPTYVSATIIDQEVDNSNGGQADGLLGASSLAAAPDGKWVYVAGAAESESAIARFSRNATTGALDFLDAKTTSELVGGFNVLSSVVKIVVAESNFSGVKTWHLYALSSHGALTVFAVNQLTGELTFVESIREAHLNIAATPKQFVGSTSLTVSPDGRQIYVSNNSATALSGGAIFVFDRTAPQAFLTFRRRLVNDPPNALDGLGGESMVVSPDNKFVYILGDSPSRPGSIAVYERLTTGSPYLALRSIVKTGGSDVENNVVIGLEGAREIVMSPVTPEAPAGRFVYVTAESDDAVTVFERNAATGALTFVQSLANGAYDDVGKLVSRLERPVALAISPDGDRVYVGASETILPGTPNEELVGSIVVFARNSSTGRLTYVDSIKDSTADAYGNGIEYIDQVTGLLAAGNATFYAAASSGFFNNAITAFQRDSVGARVVVVGVGERRLNVDLSSIALPGSISGIVYENRNGNQTPDVGEPGLFNWQVFLDVNGNGVWDSQLPGQFNVGEPIVSTDVSGFYVFAEVEAGTAYTVRPVLQSGWQATAPSAGSYAVNLEPGEGVLRHDFGLVLQNVIGAGQNSLEGIVFEDVDGDGVQAPTGERGLGGVRVFLDLNENGVRDVGEPTTVTNAATGVGLQVGKYSFANVPQVPFTVRIDPVDVGTNRRVVSPVGNVLLEQTYDLGTSVNPVALIATDFDDDGDDDLATLTLDGVVTIFFNDGSGGFSGPTLRLPNVLDATSMTVGDFNNDGLPDIALASRTSSKVWIAMNRTTPGGVPTFDPYNVSALVVSRPNRDIFAADLNGDGFDDLALAPVMPSLNVQSEVLVVHSTTLQGSMTPTFAPPPGGGVTLVGLKTTDVVKAVDVDGSGGLDLVVLHRSSRTLQVLLKSGNSYLPQTEIVLPTGKNVDAPFSLAFGEFNGDSKTDFVIGNSHTSIVSLLLSEPNANYGSQGWSLLDGVPLDAKSIPRDVATVDVDGDGDLDILVGAVEPAGVVVLRNIGTLTAPAFAPAETTGVAVLQTNDLPGVKAIAVVDVGQGLPVIAAVNGKADAGSLIVFANQRLNGGHRTIPSGGSEVALLNYALQVVLPGDYVPDGAVDGGDFLLWQRQRGQSSGVAGLGADGVADGIVDGQDLDVWRANYGSAYASQMEFQVAAASTEFENVRTDAIGAALPSDLELELAARNLWRHPNDAVFSRLLPKHESDELGIARAPDKRSSFYRTRTLASSESLVVPRPESTRRDVRNVLLVKAFDESFGEDMLESMWSDLGERKLSLRRFR